MSDMLQSDFEDFCRAHGVDAVGVFIHHQKVTPNMDATVLMHPDHIAFKPQGKVVQELCLRAAEQIRSLRRAREKLCGIEGETIEVDMWHRD